MKTKGKHLIAGREKTPLGREVQRQRCPGRRHLELRAVKAALGLRDMDAATCQGAYNCLAGLHSPRQSHSTQPTNVNSSSPRAGAELLSGSARGEADLKHSETPLTS